jgi:uncharacterized protein YigA (DUF484 family)
VSPPRGPNAEQVAAWLRDNPEFLAERPELYRDLTPPKRVFGDGVADHMAAMVDAARRQARGLAEEMAAFTTDDRAEAGLVARAQEAVLAMIAADDVVDCALHEWPALLGVESVTLAAEGTPPEPVLALERGTLDRVLPPGREAIVRPYVTDGPALHAEAAPLIVRDALVRVPMPARDLLLVLGARDAASLPLRGASGALGFLGRALATALAK